MKRIFILMLLAICTVRLSAQSKISLVPLPVKMEERKGSFVLDKQVYISYPNAKLKDLAVYLQAALVETGAKKPELRTGMWMQKGVKTISLRIDPSVTAKEGYKLEVTPTKINLIAGTENGLFYAIQTLQQLVPVDGTKKIPAVYIEDEPRFSWRGMMFDNCRHMFSVDFIKKFIDQLAKHKLNKFHWHLTEDQGWRIEIKKYPRLQEIAAYRNGTQIGPDRKKDVDSIRYGGYYTQDQIKEVVAYATSRYVEVIPEIEMPGHSVAAITAYPYLACGEVSFENGKPFEVRKVWGVSKDLYCAGNEQVFTFLEDVLSEVMPLFPSQYIHIGGDEAPHDAWKTCPKCQARMKTEGLKDEAALQSWFISRMEKFINKKGKKIIGWEEIMQGGLAENATVHSWLGVESGLKAAKSGHDAIMSPYSHMYFDGYQADSKIEPMAIGYWVPLDSVYAFEPVHPALNENEAKHILGAQGNLWTEFIGTEDYFQYMVFPRMAALSEIDWSPKAARNFDNFKGRLVDQYQRYDQQGIQFRIPVAKIELAINSADGSSSVSLIDPTQNSVIRYTLDGTEVSKSSPRYQQPVTLQKDQVIRYALFFKDQRKGSTDSYPKVKKQKK
ncbi:beta-N-acetylhexosaminidase [Pedobacter gandavensis]|uniref:beta-N-acetylhexosaminidase n=1 Tax=Pedobacter gandavensis TaxID=2679963 RepID=A0ABR6F193_9SPHI|nr:family 20 glycosylhydrolase [Pedobacter gandavensis]MBB2151211.1 family 20 glycosylhydrolase [Pedobacter gandavensis]